VTLTDDVAVSNEPSRDIVALDEALEALAKFDERKSRVSEMRFFGGLSVKETAAVLGVSAETVMRAGSRTEPGSFRKCVAEHANIPIAKRHATGLIGFSCSLLLPNGGVKSRSKQAC